MLVEVAEVVSITNGIAKVRCESKQSCGGCAAKASCGAHALSKINGEVQDHLLLQLAVSDEVEVGHRIEIGLQERSMILTALLLYIAPLSALVLSAVIGAHFIQTEWLQALVIAAATAGSFVAIRPISQRLARRQHFQPHFIRVLGKPITLSDTKFY
ncbi:hypothetical protein HPC38_09775 [Pasteurellaceae bacterium HPA106]|uniref:SoxR reducing system RseC family protein n=1 Tax=Spirabiliibacterium pneumoniae TaxID=221400 RepID=UPI001AAD2284|nr:SoxR reducing system RseC family protein [Spirabiliibacterium pneumoniae]MBE2897152.1 hypothetical protein [Spirabiliibacterium pneumoniae]